MEANPSQTENLGVMDEKYPLIKGLGTGGTSLVYLSILPGSNPPQNVAVKILKSKDINDQFNFDKLYKAEYETLQKLDYKHIMKIHGVGEGNLVLENKIMEKLKYMVFELAENGELINFISVGGKKGFSEYFARSIFRQIVSGVNEIHKAGLCHRDIKLDNTMLNKDYDIKICDFGFATDLIRNGSNLLTTTYGTPGYRAPEICLKKPYNGEKVDIFALGVSIFGLITGKVPFSEARTNVARYRLIKGKKWEKYWEVTDTPDYFRDGVSSEFKNMFQRMVAFNPDERPSAEELLNDPWFALPHSSDDETVEELKQRKALITTEEVFTVDTANELNANIVYKGASGDLSKNYFTENHLPYDGNQMKIHDNCLKIRGKTIPYEFFSKLSAAIEKNLNGTVAISNTKLKFNVSFEEENKFEEVEDEEEEDLSDILTISARYNIIDDNSGFINFQMEKGNKLEFREKVLEIIKLAKDI